MRSIDFPVKAFERLNTPFYYYDTNLLRRTLEVLKTEAGKHCVNVHYAIKANANPRILSIVKEYGFGIDCVSGGEVKAALAAGFPPSKIVYAGVGKADWEIETALDAGIFCFNTESQAELEVINELAGRKGLTARIALRINPNVHANTHHYIVTGIQENKFGINLSEMDKVVKEAVALPNVRLVGLHFHIGSQILDMQNFTDLAGRINEIQEHLAEIGVSVEHINLGGGLGIDYKEPDAHPIADFGKYFESVLGVLKLRPGQTLHMEPGRPIVAQCGSLITRVLYVKQGTEKKFIILDGSMTELIRPALYQAHHQIDNISSSAPSTEKYDVVGPVCESSDCFGVDEMLPETHRGDFVALRSAGAYGESMASNYNLRPLPKGYFSEDFLSPKAQG